MTMMVYQHIRALSGITSTLYQRPAIPAENAAFPSLGRSADRYLFAHGYNIAAFHHIEHATNSSDDLQDFIGYLHPRGMPWMEIVYLWDLIQEEEDLGT
jgi:hypothetical protein